jgi:hypothetical protein
MAGFVLWSGSVAPKSTVELGVAIRQDARVENLSVHALARHSRTVAVSILQLIGDVAVWRAANGINSHDRRPTGPAQPRTTQSLWQQNLDRHVQHVSTETFDYHAPAARAASRTSKGLRPADRDHTPQPHDAHQRQLPPGPSR